MCINVRRKLKRRGGGSWASPLATPLLPVLTPMMRFSHKYFAVIIYYFLCFSAATSYFFFDGRIDFLSSFTPSLNFYVVPIVVSISQYASFECSHLNNLFSNRKKQNLYWWFFSWSHWDPMSLQAVSSVCMKWLWTPCSSASVSINLTCKN